MNRKKLFLFVVMFATKSVLAGTVTCPTNVKINKPLVVSTKLTNSDCNGAITLTHTVVSLAGNSGSGTLGLQGPFVNGYAGTIPAATCKNIYYDPTDPTQSSYVYKTADGSATLNNLTVIGKVPAGYKGTLAIVTVGALDSNNQLRIAGTCNVTVIK